MAMTPEKILDLIKEDTNGGIQDLDNGKLKEFVKDLATFMAQENKNDEDHLKHIPIHESDYPGQDGFSLYEFFDNRIDLDGVNSEINSSDEVKNRDNFIQYIIGSLQNQSNQILWNKSMDQILKDYIDYCNKDFKIEGSTESGYEYTIDDIQHANAGRKFADGPEWVRPEKDNMGELYQDVRDNDKIDQVLKSNKNLQFTRKDKINDTTLNYYIRLIMPKYTRRVEVEDLNRNFWVIGQALSAVAAALFDNNGPIKKFMKYSLSEILQLWENVIYLWAAVRLLNEKQEEAPEPEPIPYVYTQTICQIIDLPRAADKPLRDINEFVNKFDWDETVTKLNQFTKMYSGKHLAFLLRCRIGNYEKDYYHTEIYPYIAFYDANSKEWTKTSLFNEAPEMTTYNGNPFGITLRIDSDAKVDGQYYNDKYNVQNIRDRVYAVRESSNLIRPNEYYFYWPLDNMPPYDGYKKPGESTEVDRPIDPDGENAYRGIVRIKPTIETNYTSGDTSIKVRIKFEIEDIARKLHWLTRASENSQNDDKPNDKYRDYTALNGTVYNPKYNIIECKGDGTFQEELKNFYRADSSGNHMLIIEIDWDNWGKEYNSQSNPNGTKAGFTKNFRDSGFQGSLCDMITYRGVSKTSGT